MLQGQCNRCGLCCLAEDGSRCQFLIVSAAPGEPEATRCKVYRIRYDGMAIKMVRSDGTMSPAAFHCAKDSAEEETIIIRKGIGRGCSLQVAA